MADKEMRDREQRAELDAPERESVPFPGEADREGDEESGALEPGDAPDESIFGSRWWEHGSRAEEEEPDAGDAEALEATPAASSGEATSPGAYMYRGVRYGGPVSEPEPPKPDDDDDEPVDLAALSGTPEDAPPDEDEAKEPAAASFWWERGSMAGEPPRAGAETVEADELDEAGEPDEALEPDQTLDALTPMSDDVPPAEDEPKEPAAASPWWERGSTAGEPPRAGAETVEADEPDEAVDLVEAVEPDEALDALTPMSDDVPPAEDEAEEPAAWWERGSMAGEPPGPGAEAVKADEPDEATELADAADLDEAGDALTAVSDDAPPAEAKAEEPAAEPPPRPATEALPEGLPVDLIHSMVAEVCSDELLLVETARTRLPEWAPAAVTAARSDLERRQAERRPIDAGEYLRLAIVENILGLDEEADRHLKEALPRSDRFGPVLNALAVTSLARGKIAPAIVYCKEALRETGGDDSVRAAASSNLGDFHRLQGNDVQAAEAYETAINCLGAGGKSQRLPRLHLRAGRLYQRMGQTDQARLHLSDSVRLFEDSGDAAGHVRALVALASALTESGSHDLALRHLEEGVRICLRTGDKPGGALVQAGMGVAYMAQDQLTRALAYLESALSLHRELGDREGEAAALSNIGKIHDSRGDNDKARQFYDAALRVDREQGHEAGQGQTRPHPENRDQEVAQARRLEAEEILRRARSAEWDESAPGMIPRLGPETGGLG